MNITKSIAAFVLLGTLVAPVACDNTIDCFAICNRYSDCVGEIDVTECTDLCEDRMDASDAAETDGEVCEDCTDAADSCPGVVDCFERVECRAVVVPVAE